MEADPMRRVVIVMVAGVLAVAAGLGAAFIIGMRRRSPAVIGAVRRVARAMNRLALRSAGSASAYASVVRHVGRRSGREYETPVRAVAGSGRFVIALPYGSKTDWVKNVLAQGEATIIHRGSAYRVGQPHVVPLTEDQELFSARDQRAHRLFGVTECLELRVVA
jgi:deazaflavin-dependent oxidoreductase (nitroreductase family)